MKPVNEVWTKKIAKLIDPKMTEAQKNFLVMLIFLFVVVVVPTIEGRLFAEFFKWEL